MQKSQPQTEKTTQHTEIPAWLASAVQGNIAAADNLPGYTPFTGQGVAPLTGDQRTAFDLARGNVGQGTAISMPAAGGFTNAMNFAAPEITTAGIGDGIKGLLNPYVNAQISDATGELERQRQIEEQRNGGLQARDHAFGGDRHGVVDAMSNDAFERRKTSAITGLLSGSYDKALDVSADAAKSNQGAAINSANINLAGSNGLAGLGPLLQSLGITDMNSLLTTGGLQQQNQQQQNTFDFNEFLRSQQQPFQNLQARVQATNTAPHGMDSTGTTEKEIFSNPLAGALGLGLGAFSLMSGNPMGLLSMGGALGGGGGMGIGSGNQTSRLY